ncbi:glycosyltransferase [Cognatishimia sp. 1_MG-2023]|uniref:glycosyltransferase n=1 Tax=Cognatishimia sp. 1_MG-2023 TaxID=3062642 RepID=UPI0026E12EA5|nr:glycosyltransferase [Cognatishimia sp. 1_MG-2023]MDO6728091.1 glycosyltransferase [Cognatishimia sp. 1_MG-2023]
MVSTPQNPDPHISILMATFNGAAWLPEQLASFQDQKHKNWQLIASDDGSKDGTQQLLTTFLTQNSGVYLEGPCNGCFANFLSLLKRAPTYMPAGGWFAFSDQDDVWLPERLSRGVAALNALPDDKPALYCSRTWVVDNKLGDRRLSAPRRRRPGFRNALVQSIGGGNTILVNAAAAKLLCDCAQEIDQFVSHDWWAYQVISGVGGVILHDDTPSVLYRQHDHNVVGANLGPIAQMSRLIALLKGQLRRWNTTNIHTLLTLASRLTPENRKRLTLFVRAHAGHLTARISATRRLGIYRQTRLGTACIFLSAVLNKL